MRLDPGRAAPAPSLALDGDTRPRLDPRHGRNARHPLYEAKTTAEGRRPTYLTFERV